MFKPTRSRLDSQAAAGFPAETTNVNHYHTPSYAGLVFSGFTVVVLTVVLGWLALVFLFDQAGSRRAAADAAACVMGLGIIAGVIGAVGLTARLILNDLLAHRERMGEMLLEVERVRSRAVQAIPPATGAVMIDQDKRKYRAAVMVMSRGFQSVDERGRLLTKGEPWSKRSVGGLILLGETKPIGEDTDLAKGVKPFLLERGILRDDRTVNLAKFPDLASVEADLINCFSRGVMLVSTPLLTPDSMGT